MRKVVIRVFTSFDSRHLGVSIFAFYSDDPSSNPAKAYSFNCVNRLKRAKINNKQRPGIAQLYKLVYH